MDKYLSLIPRSLQDFIHTAMEKNWEKTWDHCYVMSRKWWTGLVVFDVPKSIKVANANRVQGFCWARRIGLY